MWVGVAVFFCLLSNVLFSMRLKGALGHLGSNPRLKNVFMAHMAGMFSADVTPAKVGYFSVPLFLSKLEGIKKRESLFAILILQMLDFVIRGVAVVVGVLVFISHLSEQVSVFNLFVILIFPWLIVVCIAALLYSNRVFSLLSKLPFLSRLEGLNYKQADKNKIIFSALPITVSFIITSAIMWYCLGLSLGIEMGILKSIIFPSLLSVCFFLPITISGLGVTEGATAFVVSTTTGIPIAHAAAFAVLWRACLLLVDTIGIQTYVSISHSKHSSRA